MLFRSKIIIYTNENGNVSICFPTGVIPIEQVLLRDCPPNAIIVDSSILEGLDIEFSNAWKIVNNKIVVDFDKAKSLYIEKINMLAKQEAQNRMINNMTGIINDISDADFINILNAKRLSVNNAKNIEDLKLI